MTRDQWISEFADEDIGRNFACVIPSAIAQEVDIPRATVYRIKEDPASMEALLRVWSIA